MITTIIDKIVDAIMRWAVDHPIPITSIVVVLVIGLMVCAIYVSLRASAADADLRGHLPTVTELLDRGGDIVSLEDGGFARILMGRTVYRCDIDDNECFQAVEIGAGQQDGGRTHDE